MTTLPHCVHPQPTTETDMRADTRLVAPAVAHAVVGAALASGMTDDAFGTPSVRLADET